MTPHHAFDEIRRLCTSGASSRLVVPEVLRLLDPFLGVDATFFFWVDDDGSVCEVYAHPPPPAGLLELYAEEFHDSREDDALPRFTDSLRSGPAVATLELSRRQRERSAFYNEILRPIRSGFQAWLTVRDGVRPLALMALHRRLRAGPFTADERRRLARLGPFLAHSLAAPADSGPTVDTGESAMLVLSDEGGLLHATPDANRLLAMAARRLNWPRSGDEHPARLLPGPVSGLSRRLIGAETGAGSIPSVWSTANEWGRFIFRAYPLDPVAGDRRTVGVTVAREVPVRYRVAATLKGASLSPRQKELCVLLAGGGTYADIAARMNISRHTVVEYVQAVYDRLGVRSRESLIALLTAP